MSLSESDEHKRRKILIQMKKTYDLLMLLENIDVFWIKKKNKEVGMLGSLTSQVVQITQILILTVLYIFVWAFYLSAQAFKLIYSIL